MGGHLTKPLEEYSASELADAVEKNLGPVYLGYAASIRENSVDGALIAEMDESELKETLQDLGISSRLHCRVLTKEWKAAKQKSSRGNGISAQLEAAAEYQLSVNTPDSELEAFDEIADQAFTQCRPLFSGVHLLDKDYQVALGTRLAHESGIKTDRMHLPAEKSHCVALLLDENTPDFVDEPVPEIYHGLLKEHLPPGSEADVRYVGHVVRAKSGERIGMVCVLSASNDVGEAPEKLDLLQQLARKTEEQLELRKALLQRNQILRQQMNPQSAPELPVVSTLDEVKLSDLSRRKSLFPSPEEIAASGKPRRSAMLPIVQEMKATNKDELDHLPEDYFEKMEMFGMKDPTPVPKGDKERVAAVEALGLKNLDPDSPTAKALKSLVKLTAELFDMPMAEITFQNHDSEFSLAMYLDANKEVEDAVTAFYKPQRVDVDSNPFLCAVSVGRQPALCNYVATIKKTFVAHDVHSDESFSYMAPLGGPGFYAGSPVVVNGQALASLCAMDFRPRPDFTKAHEIQLEQLAASVGREIENWVLRREMEQLERERQLLAAERSKTKPPEGAAAIVFTDIQGSTALWEANPTAMQEALDVHDDIMRSRCAANQGYEVTTEGDAFHIAFHDALDAISFALDVQTLLHEAKWSDEILALPDATDKDGFRGLRVRIAVHYGPVERQLNDVSGRFEYSGETVHVAKSLENMAHGGQILASNDAWRGTAYLAETKLGSPQVIDLGEHVLHMGKTKRDGVIAKGVFQLVPSSLSFDYFGSGEVHPGEEKAGETSLRSSRRGSRNGRRFPPVSSMKRLSASFHEAPRDSKVVTIAFVYTSELEPLYDDPSRALAALAKLIGAILMEQDQGYQCKNTMIAFESPFAAACFGLALLDALAKHRVDGKDVSRLVKVGIYEGEFTSMGPHQSTGRADYYGRVVNRAARVAGAAEAGQVCLGVVGNEPPKLDAYLEASFVGRKQLKGVQEEVALYSCFRR